MVLTMDASKNMFRAVLWISLHDKGGHQVSVAAFVSTLSHMFDLIEEASVNEKESRDWSNRYSIIQNR